MAENGFSASDAVLTSAMSGGFNRGLGGGGQWGGGYGAGYGQFAGPAVNAMRIEKSEAVNRSDNRCVEQTLGANLDRISAQNFEGRFNAAITSIKDGQFRAELRNGDRLRDIEGKICDARAEAKDCCCETQKEILRLDKSNSLQFADMSRQQAIDTGAIQANLAAIESKLDANKEISELRAQLETQRVLVGTNNGCGIGNVPCNPCPS